jgi:hypothetical protein
MGEFVAKRLEHAAVETTVRIDRVGQGLEAGKEVILVEFVMRVSRHG